MTDGWIETFHAKKGIIRLGDDCHVLYWCEHSCEVAVCMAGMVQFRDEFVELVEDYYEENISS